MTNIGVPISIDDLAVCGYVGVMPDTRKTPRVVAQVIRSKYWASVFLPPFDFIDDSLTGASDVINRTTFNEFVDRGHLSSASTGRPSAEGCFYFPAGDSEGEYTTWDTAERWLQDFARKTARDGDVRALNGDLKQALEHYEHAAAASRRPEHYARMLIIGLSEPRKSRIMDLRVKAEAAFGRPSRHERYKLIRLLRAIQSTRENLAPSYSPSRATPNPTKRKQKNPRHAIKARNRADAA